LTAGVGEFTAVIAVTDGAWDGANARCTGNPVPGATVRATAEPVDHTGRATLTPADEVTTGDQGIAVFTVASINAGKYRLVSSFTGEQGTKAAENAPVFVFTAGPPSATDSRLSVDDNDPRLADGEASHALTIAVVDRFGNPVPERTVRFDLSSPVFATGLAPGEDATARTGPDGRATIYVRSTSAVTDSPVYAFVSQDSGSGETQLVESGTSVPQRVLLRYVPTSVDPANSGFEVVTRHADPPPVAGVGQHRVVAVLNDSRGNPAAVDPALLGGTVRIPDRPDGVLGSWSRDESDPTGATYWAPATSNAAGTATVTVTYGGAEILPLPSGSGLAADTAPFAPGEISLARSRFSVTDTDDVVADGVSCQTATVTLVDAVGNPLVLSL
jgi:hypothetical protein